MAKLHILERVSADQYSCLVHNSIPVLNNSAGVSWADLLKRVGISGSTKLEESDKVTSIVNVLDGNGDPIPLLDENGDPVLDGNGDPVYQTETQTDEVLGPGQVTDAEALEIADGTVVEIPGVIKFSGAPNAAALTKLVSRLVRDWKAEMAVKYKWYGKTRG